MDTEPPPAALVARARELWEGLAGEAAGFVSVLSVAVSRGSGLGPAGWAGLVVLDGAVLATAPDHDTARVIEQALGGLPAASAAVAHAIAEGRRPQWRARPLASRRVARALGFRELGFQVCLRPAVRP